MTVGGVSTQGLTPGYIDDTEPDIMRLAIDDSSGLIAGDEQAPVTDWYILDSVGRVHITLMWIDGEGGHVMTFGEDYLGDGGALGIDFGGTAVDILVLPAREYEFGDWNWLCVLVDTGSGWTVKVYEMDYIGPDPENPELTITEKATLETSPGVPSAFDADNYEYELHVVADDGGTYKVTVWQYSE